jgi:tetratricopeptide (TPR) repeat protein
LRTLATALRCEPSYAPAAALRRTLLVLEQREKRRRREPRNARAQLEAGFSYLLASRCREAVDALGTAARLEPTHYLAHLLYGIALHGEGETQIAKRAYESAARLKPYEEVPRRLIAALERGEPPPPMVDATPDARRARSSSDDSSRAPDRQPAALSAAS